MTFGPYPDGMCLYIEKSKCYEKIQEGVQIAEFLLLRHQEGGPTVWVVEAKSSSPRTESQPNFDEFIDEIRNKLTNRFLLTVAARLRRHSDAEAEMSQAFNVLDLRELGFRFVLVINGHQQAWLPPLQSALALALRPIVRSWALPPTSVVVMNHELAQRHGPILAHAQPRDASGHAHSGATVVTGKRVGEGIGR